MRWFVGLCILVTLGSCKEEAFIPGTGTLPDCNDPPVVDLNGTLWFNRGTVTILTAGCADEEPNAMLVSCPENWALTQTGNDLDIVVDEYRLNGRICGDRLYLEGGWWLSVTDDQGACLYRDDDGDEFGIESEGNVLTYTPADPDTSTKAQLKGILVLQGSCRASYDATFELVGNPPPN